MVACNVGELPSESALPRADHSACRGDAVRLGDRGGVVERSVEVFHLAVEVRIQRELLRDEERRDEDDPRAAVCGEPAGEVERVLGLSPPEERHDDAAIADGGRSPGEATGLPAERTEVGAPHHST